MVNLDNLFKRIDELGLTAKKVSASTKISTGNISDWKNGKCLPTATKLYILADYLNCSVDYLLGRSNNPNRDFSGNSISNATITGNAVVQGNNNNNTNMTVNNNDIKKKELSKQALQLVEIFEDLEVREQIELLTKAFDLEAKNKKDKIL